MPAPTSDETQPTRPLAGDTQPTTHTQRQRPMDRTQWLLLVVILIASIMLLVTLQYAAEFDPVAPVLTQRVPLNVVINVDGQRETVQTRAGTVGTLLAEHGLRVTADDWIAPAPDAALQDGLVITLRRARAVTLIDDGLHQTLHTPLTSPYAILETADALPRLADRIWIDGTETDAESLRQWPVPPLEIEIDRAVTLTIDDDGQQQTLRTTAPTVGDALFEADIAVYEADTVMPPLATRLDAATTITIERAQPVIIAVDDTTIETRVRGGTVGAALAEHDVALVGLDFVLPPEDTPLEAGMRIRVMRVTEDVLTRTETIPYQTVYQADATLALDTQAVRQAGRAGVRTYYTRVRYANGEEIAREPAGDEVTRAAVNEVIAYGTNVVLRTIDTPEGPRQYWRQLRVYATSYHPASVGGSTTTSIGMTLAKGIIAADPGIIPYRTNLYVPGYGTGLMADTGGPRSTRYWIDLGYSDEDYQPWSRYVDVYLLAPVPQTIRYRLPPFTPIGG